ncbi:MAG TPA: lytic transglycosylase domain-containing protein [Spirochaetota bacterium]|jgi:soluble lytic murein transglycosylase-like protein|nr:lytic transglycosylase domain-containing protein [Spirochaetota bacterium]OQA96709.1 MAG: Soluble lytic murein transglycosylase precursor [Spirochaetes bacterium ADurb.Bin218]HOK00919.1 lytic transglycosylase domain-containing protein [Spirochaetota bacterium]HOK91255.1 lytic transglycosylase domain-containing protein [Spirochaetota bacterium]HON17028.1 lytic transglycosylase domain-containing protein [Spirochaetota bacterium]
MIEDMYNVLARINEIKGRFGLNKVASTPEVKAATQSFSDMVDNSSILLKKELNIDPDKPLSKGDIDKIVEYYASRNNVPASLVKSIIKAESDYNPEAISPKGAMGLMQLMPETVMSLGIENPFDPEQNIKGGIIFFKDLLNSYKGDYKLALAAYNSGKGNVDKYGGVPDFKETKDYVRKVIDYYVSDEGKIKK